MKPGSGWPLAVVGLLGMNMAIVGVTVYFATTSKTSAVVPDYYTKAVHWEDTQRQQATNRALGWTTAWRARAGGEGGPGDLELTLADGAGKALRAAKVEFEVFHESDDTRRVSGVMPISQSGRWRVHAVIDSLGTRFTAEATVEAGR